MSAPDPQALAAAMPFAVALGAEVTAATPEEVRGRLAWAPARCTSGGALHGGAIMALADTLGAICLLEPAARRRHLDHRVEDELLLAGAERAR